MSKIRINFNKKLKMHKACANDTLRPVMNCIYFKDGFAYASEGHILVKNKLEECSTLDESAINALDGKLLPYNSFASILKYDTIIISDDGIEACKGDNKAFFYFMKDLKYPDIEKVIQDSLNKQCVPVSEIGLNMSLLIRLNDALYGSEKCKLQFYGTSSVTIFHRFEQESMGIIMPLIIQGH